MLKSPHRRRRRRRRSMQERAKGVIGLRDYNSTRRSLSALGAETLQHTITAS